MAVASGFFCPSEEEPGICLTSLAVLTAHLYFFASIRPCTVPAHGPKRWKAANLQEKQTETEKTPQRSGANIWYMQVGEANEKINDRVGKGPPLQGQEAAVSKSAPDSSLPISIHPARNTPSIPPSRFGGTISLDVSIPESRDASAGFSLLTLHSLGFAGAHFAAAQGVQGCICAEVFQVSRIFDLVCSDFPRWFDFVFVCIAHVALGMEDFQTSPFRGGRCERMKEKTIGAVP